MKRESLKKFFGLSGYLLLLGTILDSGLMQNFIKLTQTTSSSIKLSILQQRIL